MRKPNTSITWAKVLCSRAHLRVDAPRRLDPADERGAAGLPWSAAAPAAPRSCASASRRSSRLRADALFEHRVPPRMQRAETEILQLGLDQVHAQALRDRRVDLQRFARDAAGAPRVDCAPSVRMLCRRSASLIRITRRSRAIASSILRKLSAAASWRSRNCSLSSLVTPSTSSATVSPNSPASASRGQRRVLDGVVQDRRDQGLDIDAAARRAPWRRRPDG